MPWNILTGGKWHWGGRCLFDEGCPIFPGCGSLIKKWTLGDEIIRVGCERWNNEREYGELAQLTNERDAALGRSAELESAIAETCAMCGTTLGCESNNGNEEWDCPIYKYSGLRVE